MAPKRIKVKALWATTCIASASHIGGLIVVHATEQAAEEVTCLIPFIGWLAAGSLSFVGTY